MDAKWSPVARTRRKPAAKPTVVFSRLSLIISLSSVGVASSALVLPPSKATVCLPVTALDGKPLDLAAQPAWKVVYFWSATCSCARLRVFTLGFPLAWRYEAQNGRWDVSRTYLAQAIAQTLVGQMITIPTVKDQGCIIAW